MGYRLKVREEAERQGYNQSSLSRATNISFTTIRKIWRDEHYAINIVTLNQIAKVLHIHTADLIEDED